MVSAVSVLLAPARRAFVFSSPSFPLSCVSLRRTSSSAPALRPAMVLDTSDGPANQASPCLPQRDGTQLVVPMPSFLFRPCITTLYVISLRLVNQILLFSDQGSASFQIHTRLLCTFSTLDFMGYPSLLEQPSRSASNRAVAASDRRGLRPEPLVALLVAHAVFHRCGMVRVSARTLSQVKGQERLILLRLSLACRSMLRYTQVP